MIFDTHTHLNLPHFAGEEERILKRAQQLGVTEMAVVGMDRETIKQTLSLAKEYKNIHSILGWHPTNAGSYTREVEQALQADLATTTVIALGEIGLDYHWMKDPKDIQEKVFRRQLAVAREMKLPVSIHSRDALADTYRILKEERIHEIGGIMHSFSGDTEWMKAFLDLGMEISLSGVVTFKKATEIHQVAQAVPLENLLVETDAPYLTPAPYRGKRNEPGYTRYVVERIAELRELSIEEISQQTFSNAYRIFGLDE